MQPWELGGLRRVRRWRRGHISHWECRHVALGQLPDGRWVVEHTDVKVGARAYQSPERAERAVTELMWQGDWVEVPAVYRANGQPAGEGWVRRGGTWVRSEDAPEQR